MPLDPAHEQTAVQIAARLRLAGRSADFSYKTSGLAKQLKFATAANARFCVILGEEFARDGRLVIKDLSSGQQTTPTSDEFWTSIESA